MWLRIDVKTVIATLRSSLQCVSVLGEPLLVKSILSDNRVKAVSPEVSDIY